MLGMDYTLNEEQQLLCQSVRRLTQSEVSRRAAEIDERGEFPWDLFQLFREQGLFALIFPTDYGGAGSSLLNLCLVLEEIAKVSKDSAAICANVTLAPQVILIAGSEEQKQRYLTKVASGEWVSSLALTEPGAGSDAASIQTRALRQEEGYLVRGNKCFISFADVAHFFVVFAKTDPSKGVRGISAFVLDRDTPGLSIGRKENKMGGRAIQACEVIFEDCRLPFTALLGREGEGFHYAMGALDSARCACGAEAVGIAQGALDYALDYAKGRVQFGKPIAQFQAIQFMLADMATEIEAARQLVYKAACLVDQGHPQRTRFSAMAKYFATDVAMKVTVDAIQVMGGYGYMKDHPLERMMRDVKLLQIVEGTNQIQRLVVARSLLG